MAISERADDRCERRGTTTSPGLAWSGGVSGHYDEGGDFVAAASWSFANAALSLSLRVTSLRGSGTKRWHASYGFGLRHWRADGRCRSLVGAQRAAVAALSDHFREAWNHVWGGAADVYAWGGSGWEHVASVVESAPDHVAASLGCSKVAYVERGRRPWYVEYDYLARCGSSSPPRGLPELQVEVSDG